MSIKETLWTYALELFMKYGIKSVSMDDLARSMGVSKKTIYTFISNKDELIFKVIKRHLDNDEQAIREIVSKATDALDEMSLITRHVLLFLRKIKPSLIYDLKKYHPQSWQLIKEQHFAFIEDVIKTNIYRGQKENLYRKDLHPEIISKLYVAKSQCVVDEELFPLAEFDRVELLKQMLFYHLNGIASDEGKTRLQEFPI